ncbi:dTDP-4-dehydrorhamnose reductase [Streptomyces malaysiense]|uniref:dTDP-4-dehydrorhamnose reductase n=1 Tax=Streptomyces malaysiense TaxID=1428626 RepID=A0A1J4Q6B9_9ACTN|nr:dTDP-4-dehydrorhamnose reductase [Streptomyces malaysiense]OIK28709.1 dTDP-4-dehydrorhamnose reductase [Streptomyces malaysiense]
MNGTTPAAGPGGRRAAGPLPHRWLVTGGSGMLGHDLLALLAARDEVEVVAPRRDELDITDPRAVREQIGAHRPQIVVNCAAWTAVDDAEEHEAEAYAVNGEGPRHLARACAAAGARLLHVSTDYVFSGRRPPSAAGYAEDAGTGPGTAYGRGKLAGERGVLEELPAAGTVVRTAWLYGRHGRSFVRTMAERAASPGEVRIVDDQHGQPTWTKEVAARLVLLAGVPADRARGVFHATAAGHTSWYGLARAVFSLLDADPERVRPTDSAALDRPARRPAWSVLADHRWPHVGGAPMRPWRDVLSDSLAEVLDLASVEHRGSLGADAEGPPRPPGQLPRVVPRG